MTIHTENKSFIGGIVINCFENIYCQMYIRLNKVCFQFGIIQKNKKPSFFVLRHETFVQ